MIEGIDHLGLRLVDQPVLHVGGGEDALAAVFASQEGEQVDQIVVGVDLVHDLALVVHPAVQQGVEVFSKQGVDVRMGLFGILIRGGGVSIHDECIGPQLPSVRNKYVTRF